MRSPSGSILVQAQLERPLIPPEIISLIAYYAHLNRDLGTLATVMRTCRAGYSIAGPLLYRDLEMDGPKALEKISQGLRRDVVDKSAWTAAGHKRKTDLFAYTETLTFHAPSRCPKGRKRSEIIACWLALRNELDPILFPRLRQVTLSGHYRITRTVSTSADELDLCIHVLDSDKYKDRPGLVSFLPIAIGAVSRSKQIHTIYIHNISWGDTNMFGLLPPAQHVRIVCPPPTIELNLKDADNEHREEIDLYEYREALYRDINYHMLDFDAFYRHLSVELVNFGVMFQPTTDKALEFAAIRREVVRDCALDFGLEEMGDERPPMVNEMGGSLLVRTLTVDTGQRECTVCRGDHMKEGDSVPVSTPEPVAYESMTFYRYTRPS